MKILGVILGVLLVFSSTSANSEDDEVVVETAAEDVQQPSVDVPYQSPEVQDKGKVYFSEHFDDESKVEKRWVRSEAKKEGIAEEIAKYDGEWKVEKPLRDGLVGDKGLVLKTHAKHAAISSVLNKPFVFNDKSLIVQYEVTLQDGQQCGGAYLKLLSKTSKPLNLKDFQDKTPYTIMFGPDKCGVDYKLHFIFNHKNPLNGSIEEKHCKKPEVRLEDLINDKNPHLYTLILSPNNTFEIHIDNKLVNSGNLLDDFVPSVNPPKEIEDPSDQKPEDWDEREKIPDPTASKPEDWDEEAPAQIVDETAVKPEGWLDHEQPHIPDPDAQKPADWDSEMDGEWEPPLIDNPACAAAAGCGAWEPPTVNNPMYKGKWRAPMIDNPNYKGKWRPRLVPNPDFFEDKTPFKMTTVEAIGFELWSMSRDILFDNIIITEDIGVANQWAAVTFERKRQKIAKDSDSHWGRFLKATNNKPGWWGLYFVYCLIPISMYIGYLYFCVKEESVVDKLASLTVDYPILWGVYILALGIPVVLILYCCFKPSSAAKKEKEELRDQAEKKKTDELTEDVAEENEEAEEAEEENEEEEGAEEEDEVEAEVPSTSERPPEESARKRKVRKE